jgi:tetratricopeptide (TPR) repeat protein
MKHGIHIGLILACCFAVSPALRAQASQPRQNPKSSTMPSTTGAQKPATESNPFPEDTSNVPVVPTTGSPAIPPPPLSGSNTETTTLLRQDTDPIKSPDDPAPETSSSSEGFSSSLTGVDELKPPPDEEKTRKRGKQQLDEPVHHESAKEDEDTGNFYLDQKNWKAALSRFESALVLDPENPDVYWGLAEAQRQLGKYSNAKANYEKVVEYDPDSKHGKEAKKYLKLPQIANAPAVSSTLPAAQSQQ